MNSIHFIRAGLMLFIVLILFGQPATAVVQPFPGQVEPTQYISAPTYEGVLDYIGPGGWQGYTIDVANGEDRTILALVYIETNDFDLYVYDPVSNAIIASATESTLLTNGYDFTRAVSSLAPGRYYIVIHSNGGSGYFAFLHFTRNSQTPAATLTSPVISPTPTTLGTKSLIDLMNEGKVSVKVTGRSIQEVTLELTLEPSVGTNVDVEIEEGTYFPAKSGDYQNMMSIRGKRIILQPGISVDVSVDVVCTNIHKGIPDSGQQLSVQAGPSQDELIQLIPYLTSEPDSIAVQAAVWIVTDNADFDDLGILIRSSGGRVITETEAVKGLRLLDNAGIGITNKAIWSDRQSLMAGLSDGTLREWLRQHS